MKADCGLTVAPVSQCHFVESDREAGAVLRSRQRGTAAVSQLDGSNH